MITASKKIIPVVLCTLLLALTFAVVMVSSAGEISASDNIDLYDSTNKIVTIKDKDLAEIGTIELKAIKGNTNPFRAEVGIGPDTRVLEFQTIATKDYTNLVGEIFAYDVTDNNKSISKTFNVKYRTTEAITDLNGTKYNVDFWYPLEKANIVAGENITIGIYTDTHLGEEIDIIPTIYDAKIDRWAVYVANAFPIATAYGGRPEFNGIKITTNATLPTGTKLTKITYACSMSTGNTPQLLDSGHSVVATGGAISGCNSTFDYTLVASTTYFVGAVGDESANSMYYSNSAPYPVYGTYFTWVIGYSAYAGWGEDATARNVRGLTLELPVVPVPNLTIVYPTNTTYNLATKPTRINVTIQNASSLVCKYTTNNWATNTSTGCGNVTGLSTTEGTNVWGYVINDSTNNFNQTQVTFQVDTIAPRISIAYPLNQTYKVNVSTMNYTNNSIGHCWYSTNDGTTNSTINACTNFTNILSSQGTNRWTVYSNDTFNNLNSTNITFLMDTVIPAITMPGNQTFEKTIFQFIDALPVNAISNDTYVSSRWFNITEDGSLIVGNTFSDTYSIMFDHAGTFNVSVSINDTAGNMNYTSGIVTINLRAAGSSGGGGLSTASIADIKQAAMVPISWFDDVLKKYGGLIFIGVIIAIALFARKQ